MSETPLNKKQIALERTVKIVKTIAGGTQKGLSYFLIVGIVSTLYCLYLSYSSEVSHWWNAVKGIIIVAPVVLLGFVWTVLGQLREAPDNLAKLNQGTRNAYSGIKELKNEPKGLRGLFRVLNQFRREGNLFEVFDTVGSIGLMVNPLFLFLVFLAAVILFLLNFVALLIFIF